MSYNKNKYIDGQNYLQEKPDTLFKTVDDIYLSPNDPIRFGAGNFWYSSKNGLEKYNLSSLFTINSRIENGKEIVTIKANEDKFSKNYFENGILKKKFDYKAWEKFVSEALSFGLESQKQFVDHYFQLDIPNKVEETNKISQNYSYNREFVYNFSSPAYEAAISDPNAKEDYFPSAYDIVDDLSADIQTERENLKLTLGGLVSDSLSDSLLLSNKINDSIKLYFETYGNAYLSANSLPVIQELELRRVLNEVYESKKLETINYYNFNQVPFPYYLDFKFYNDTLNSNTLKMLKKNHLETNLMNSYITYIQGDIVQSADFFEFENGKKFPSFKTVNIFDIKKWIKDGLENKLSTDDINTSQMMINASMISMLQDIKKNFAKRTFQEVLDSKTSNSDIVAYKLIKRSLTAKGEPLKVLYFKPTDKDTIRFIDTQLKYDRNYVYELYALTVVYGNKYLYKNDYYSNDVQKKNDIENGFYSFTVENESSIQLAELPYISFEGTVIEYPTNKPLVQVSNIDNSVKLHIEQSNDAFEKPEYLETKDVEVYDKVLKSQENNEEKVYFSSNIKPTKLQVYRLSFKPKTYLDFNGRLTKVVDLEKPEITLFDKLNDNKKYYYCFRYLNSHNVPSNPSLVYEVEIVNESGIRYLRMKQHDLKPVVVKNYFKDMKRYVLIKPALNQTIISNDLEKLVEDLKNSNNYPIDLGVSEKKVWDRDYKLRIRSKDTGKILEFDFKFTVDKNKK